MLARWHAKRSLQAEVARFVSASVLVAVSILTIAMFVAESRGWPGGLPPLGADYADFYMIGKLQGEYGVARLYDLGLQDRILHAIVPRMPSDEHLPFVYPPFLALAFRPLARLPYPASFAAWIAITAAFYATSLALVLRDSPTIPGPDRITACLLAASFEPFAMECVLGGQLSAIGCFGVAATLVCDRRGQPVLAGVALALLSYKPTLLVLVLPMLVAGGRWRTLAGFLGGGAALAVSSLVIAGRGPCLDFLNLMVGYGWIGGSRGAIFKTIKFVDLGAFLKLLSVPPAVIPPLWLILSAPVIATLVAAWRRSARANRDARVMAMAATLCWTPVLNIYGPVYDVILVVPGLILAADVIRRRYPIGWPTSFAAFVAALYVSAWISPIVATVGFQTLTLGLAIMANCLTRVALRPPAWNVGRVGALAEEFGALRAGAGHDRLDS